MTEDFYCAPVDQLLSLGEPAPNERLDYAGMGVSAENIPDLIRMATDERLNNAPGDSKLVWAPVHAWRALGQLRAVMAVEPLLKLFQRIDDFSDDWIGTDLPMALAQIGAAAIEPAANYLADAGHGEWARTAAAATLGKIGCEHPLLRLECVARLSAQLEKFSEQSETLNAFLVSPLWDLRAVEALPVIERAHAAGKVDESVNGDVEDVQIHFGLKTERERPARPNRLTELRERLLSALEDNEQDSIMDDLMLGPRAEPYVAPAKVGRNEPCPCGSGKKYKKCCGA
jgi:HEAT repeat protein